MKANLSGKRLCARCSLVNLFSSDRANPISCGPLFEMADEQLTCVGFEATSSLQVETETEATKESKRAITTSANRPHAVKTVTRFKMLLVMMRVN